MKKKIILSLIVIAALLVLFLPVSQTSYDDGGTREYSALTYKIVKWKRPVSVYDENGVLERIDIYTDTSVYWFPYNLKSIDELWQTEKANASLDGTDSLYE